ncbi:unnamed protein product [Trypanosoma congolense IL3000]|uniref:WGS project CAEQ00000000 data, annotated contig 1380 n=1 Tax=Trypanosoma congolense (strain IL3000) TaxID=1068625 RepID=F9W5U7_TRYCI|nr:unnamed protein product [Trypanosoma congolense IL3000]
MVFQTYCLNDVEKEIVTTYAVPLLYEWCPSLRRPRHPACPPQRCQSCWGIFCITFIGGVGVGRCDVWKVRGIIRFLVKKERVVHPELQSGQGAFRFLRVARHFLQSLGGVLELLHTFDAAVFQGVLVVDTNIPNSSDRVFVANSVCIWCDIRKH